MNWILYFVFALSGAASLAFETLWFRQAGLTFGNSVWASSLVLSSFMAGIALGNGIAARYAARLARPILAYALLELGVGVSAQSSRGSLPMMPSAPLVHWSPSASLTAHVPAASFVWPCIDGWK